MLIETRRKRKRAGGGGGAAFTTADLPRPPRRAVPQTPVSAAEAAAVVASPQPTARPRMRPAEIQEAKEEESQSLHTYTMMSTPLPARHLVDRRVLLSRASRMQLMLLERLRCVSLRRARRIELLNEITRLKKIMATLQNDIDATTRSLESLELFVHHLQRMSFDVSGLSTIQIDGAGDNRSSLPTASRLVPGTILWTNPALRSSEDRGGVGTQVEQLVTEGDARKAKANGTGGHDAGVGGCRFASSHPG